MPSAAQPRADQFGGKVRLAYRAKYGRMLEGRIEDALNDRRVRAIQGKVDLIFTSPPFPLVRKKKYGNLTGEEYLDWLKELAPRLAALLSPQGSLVIEIGNAWEEGLPAMSTLPVRALLAFQEASGLQLCQSIICHNPARLPTPAEWVTVRRIRLKDSFTHVWWLSASPAETKANNRKVLLPYSAHMRSLLKRKKYNAGARPSGHVISETGFLTDHGGAISPSVIDLIDEDDKKVPLSVLPFSNTAWHAGYAEYCESHEIDPHPARMRPDLVAFFVEFLTDEGDLVFDPFGGSNTTGAVSEEMRRRWMSVELDPKYIEGSRGRFGNLYG